MSHRLKLLNLIIIYSFCLISHAQTKYEDYSAAQNIFSDDFSKNVGWVTGSSADNCYSSKIENGSFEIISTCKGIYPSYWITSAIDVTRDFEIEAEILYINGETDNGVSLVWGKDDNYHRFNFEFTGGGYLKIFQFNGNFITLKDWTFSDLIKKSDYNKLTIRKIASEYYFFLNDKLVYNSEFLPFFGNQIGFQDNQNTTMKVNNLKVSYLKPNQGFTKSNPENTDAASNKIVNSDSNQDLQRITLQPYVAISADYILLAGNFDGKSIFTLPTDEIILVPKLSPAAGFGVQFGIRSKHTEFDWAYNLSRMKYTSLKDGFSGISTNHFIRLLGVKGFIGSSYKKKTKLYIYIDWSLASSHFEKLAYDPSAPSNFKSANYLGMIVGLGAGIQFNLTKHFALDLRVLPEYYFGTDIKSKEERDYSIEKFKNFLLINSIGVNYYFNKK